MATEAEAAIAAGDTIEVLNLGGVLGRCTAGNPDLGPPFTAEVLGAVLTLQPMTSPSRTARVRGVGRPIQLSSSARNASLNPGSARASRAPDSSTARAGISVSGTNRPPYSP